MKFDTEDKLKYGFEVYLDFHINPESRICRLFYVPELDRYVIRYTPSGYGYASIAEAYANGTINTATASGKNIWVRNKTEFVRWAFVPF